MKVPGKEVLVFPIPTGRFSLSEGATARPPHTASCLSPPASSPGDLLTTHWPRPQRDVTPSSTSLPSSWEPGLQGSAQDGLQGSRRLRGRHLSRMPLAKHGAWHLLLGTCGQQTG